MKLSDPERVRAVAGEYVLGTLSGRARARFERLLRTEPRVTEAVREWEERLLPLAEVLPPVAPPDRVWTAILSRIPSAAGKPVAPSSPWGRMEIWRGLALASLAVVVALAVALLKPAAERPEGALIAVLSSQDATPALIASTDRASRYLTIAAIAPLAVANDRALELWMLPKEGKPRSLGLVSAVAPSGVARIVLPARADQALQNIPALAVSLEPVGGSPTGLPTGPVLYSGPLRRLE